MKSMKMQKGTTVIDELCRSVGARYITREIAPERMKRQSQSKNNTQVCMSLGMDEKSDAVESYIA